MTNKMNDLATALTAAGATVRTQGDMLFVNQWGIFCSLTGQVQARSVWDKHDRFGVGDMSTPADAMAATILSLS